RNRGRPAGVCTRHFGPGLYRLSLVTQWGSVQYRPSSKVGVGFPSATTLDALTAGSGMAPPKISVMEDLTELRVMVYITGYGKHLPHHQPPRRNPLRVLRLPPLRTRRTKEPRLPRRHHRQHQQLRHPLRRSPPRRSEEHTSELQSRENLVCRLLLEKKNK